MDDFPLHPNGLLQSDNCFRQRVLYGLGSPSTRLSHGRLGFGDIQDHPVACIRLLLSQTVQYNMWLARILSKSCRYAESARGDLVSILIASRTVVAHARTNAQFSTR
jgi:hypothetical protein